MRRLAPAEDPRLDHLIAKAQAVPEAPPETVQLRPPASDKVAVAIPSNCRADGEIDPRIGVDGKPYAIGFAIALPSAGMGDFCFKAAAG
jgi:feruloyl esterase